MDKNIDPVAMSSVGPVHPVLTRLGTTSASLGTQARQGGVWAGGARIFVQVVQFLVTLVTARLLVPGDYGQTAIIFSISAFANIFTDLGLGAAIVHAKAVTEELLSSAFWLNGLSGLVLTAGVSGLSFPLAHLYDQPNLVPLMVIASMQFTVNAGTVHTALLERTFRFKQLAIIETSASMINFGVLIALAAAGGGPYALAWGPLAGVVSRTVFLVVVVRWIPHALPRKRAVAELWNFSRGLTGFNAINFWARNLDNVLIQKTASATATGNYTRSYQLMLLPVAQMNLVLGRILFPALTRMRDDMPRVGRAYLNAVTASTAITFPITVGIAISAPELVETLYGNRWSGMTPILRLLALAAVPQLLAATSGSVFRATGTTDRLFRLSLVTTGMTVVAIVAGLPWGPVGVAAALLVSSFVSLPVVFTPMLRSIKLRWSQVFRSLKGSLLASTVLVVVVLSVRGAIRGDVNHLELLVVDVVIGSVSYALALVVLGRTTWRTLLSIRSGRSFIGR
jgi:PST family polysaccharide transporter